ncbi:hypothetical protein AALP_AA4G107600 [Arabis alpina]|uniref:RING-type E3 ubiquitin transferase n=1 Tax=Arabis alpina TaxID=50452 RepID=A0A087H2H0_ARAAL|nr:hypothetical protein AALP_AA4G107600 [Arabis alpina]
MATAAIIASVRRRILPFLAPLDLSDEPLVQTLASISSEIISCFTGVSFSFQRRNSRSLIRKIQIFLVLFQYLADSGFDSNYSSTALTCFKELYLTLYLSKILVHYCAHSSKLWLLLQTPLVSGFFDILNGDFSTLLDVFPINNLRLSDDIREHIELLKKQSSNSRLFIDVNEEMLRERLYSFLDGFENGRIPDSQDLRDFFVEKLKIRDPKTCVAEIGFLEEQIMYYDSDLEPTGSVIKGFIDMIRYCRFLLFGIEDNGLEWRIKNSEKQRKCFIAQEIGDTFRNVPNDFICSISLDLMKDPVIVSTGKTYDRISIDSWIEAGHSTCPTTRQTLMDSSSMVPNRALSRLITWWCTATGISLESEDSVYCPNESLASVLKSRASVEAIKATIMILIQNLENGSESAQTVAAQELRLLARFGVEERLLIAEAGAIPHLHMLLKSENGITQEISITAMFNLAVQEKNRSLIMEENDCLESIVSVLVSGLTMEARENAALLFCLSLTEAYKIQIANANGCIESFAWLIQNGTPRGKKDVMKLLFNISIHPDSCMRMVNSGGVSAIVGALADEVVAERAAKVLAEVAKQSLGAETIGREESAIPGLVKLMRCGTPKGKEFAADALLQLCMRSGTVVVGKVVKAPAITFLMNKLYWTGSDRAKRKANSLALLLKKSRNAGMMRSGNREESFQTDVHVPISIPVSLQ